MRLSSASFPDAMKHVHRLKRLRVARPAIDIARAIVLQNPFHQKKMRRFYSRFMRQGDLCFDVGAHVGGRTKIFVQLGARVVCVEPQGSCAKRLGKRFAREDVIILQQALAATEGETDLWVCEEATPISTTSARWMRESRFAGLHRWTRAERVATTTLDALIARYGMPRFCKIDVEGSEAAVLQGLSRPIPFISFEFARELFDELGKCLDYLCSLGPARYNCSPWESMELLFSQWVTADELQRSLRVHPDSLLCGDIYARFD